MCMNKEGIFLCFKFTLVIGYLLVSGGSVEQQTMLF